MRVPTFRLSIGALGVIAIIIIAYLFNSSPLIPGQVSNTEEGGWGAVKGLAGSVVQMVEYDDTLYAMGDLSIGSRSDIHLAKLEGGTWKEVGQLDDSTYTYTIDQIGVAGDQIYAVGMFPGVSSPAELCPNGEDCSTSIIATLENDSWVGMYPYNQYKSTGDFRYVWDVDDFYIVGETEFASWDVSAEEWKEHSGPCGQNGFSDVRSQDAVYVWNGVEDPYKASICDSVPNRIEGVAYYKNGTWQAVTPDSLNASMLRFTRSGEKHFAIGQGGGWWSESFPAKIADQFVGISNGDGSFEILSSWESNDSVRVRSLYHYSNESGGSTAEEIYMAANLNTYSSTTGKLEQGVFRYVEGGWNMVGPPLPEAQDLIILDDIMYVLAAGVIYDCPEGNGCTEVAAGASSSADGPSTSSKKCVNNLLENADFNVAVTESREWSGSPGQVVGMTMGVEPLGMAVSSGGSQCVTPTAQPTQPGQSSSSKSAPSSTTMNVGTSIYFIPLPDNPAKPNSDYGIYPIDNPKLYITILEAEVSPGTWKPFFDSSNTKQNITSSELAKVVSKQSAIRARTPVDYTTLVQTFPHLDKTSLKATKEIIMNSSQPDHIRVIRNGDLYPLLSKIYYDHYTYFPEADPDFQQKLTRTWPAPPPWTKPYSPPHNWGQPLNNISAVYPSDYLMQLESRCLNCGFIVLSLPNGRLDFVSVHPSVKGFFDANARAKLGPNDALIMAEYETQDQRSYKPSNLTLESYSVNGDNLVESIKYVPKDAFVKTHPDLAISDADRTDHQVSDYIFTKAHPNLDFMDRVYHISSGNVSMIHNNWWAVSTPSPSAALPSNALSASLTAQTTSSALIREEACKKKFSLIDLGLEKVTIQDHGSSVVSTYTYNGNPTFQASGPQSNRNEVFFPDPEDSTEPRSVRTSFNIRFIRDGTLVNKDAEILMHFADGSIIDADPGTNFHPSKISGRVVIGGYPFCSSGEESSSSSCSFGMWQFLATGSGSTNLSGDRSALWQIVPIGEGAKVGDILGLSAMFNRATGNKDSDTEFDVQIRAYDFPISQFSSRKESFIAQQQASIRTDDQAASWEQAFATLEVPPSTTFLAVSINAVENVQNDTAGSEFNGHFADSVCLQVLPNCEDGVDADGDGLLDDPIDGCSDSMSSSSSSRSQSSKSSSSSSRSRSSRSSSSSSRSQSSRSSLSSSRSSSSSSIAPSLSFFSSSSTLATGSSPSSSAITVLSCQDNTQCPDDQMCLDGRCVIQKQLEGEECTNNAQCLSGMCIDGLCSDQHIIAFDPFCGDNKVTAGELCDPPGSIVNNQVDGSYRVCSPTCQLESAVIRGSAEFCGNGIIDPGEQCDDGNRRNADGCSALCTIESSILAGSIGQNPTTIAGNGTSNTNIAGNVSGSPSQHAPVGDTGPATVAIMVAGAAAGFAWMRRRMKKSTA